ncbi:MAG: hypothetical protein KDC54_10575 [Lewinella sp.]|nr:hypothetical protein [Lewinella sp.]
MVHRFIILLLLAGAWGVALSAQSSPEAPDPTLLALDLPEVVDGSVAHLRQIGDFNEIAVEQINRQAIAVQQLGNYNQLNATLEGGPNMVLAEQVGHGNRYDLYLEGAHNELIIGQYGNDNTLIQDLQGAEYLFLRIEQHGDGNWIEHTEFNASSYGVPLEIQQAGGMHLQITNLADYFGG